MKPEVKELWCQALESEEWEQTKGVLCQRGEDGPDSYCCWGVLTEISGMVKGIDAQTLYSDREVKSYDGQLCYPPHEVLEWAGFPMDEGRDNIVRPLATLNDQGKTFQEIAKHIRENY